jgi:hypothetical protein
MVHIAGLPEECQPLADHMTRYGILIEPDERRGWRITVPADIPVDRVRHVTYASSGGLRDQLFQVMRAFEVKVDILIRYQQGAWGRSDCPWSAVRYGTRSCASTMEQGGCGPTSVAIILHYYLARLRYTPGTRLMPRQITPLETCNHFGTDGNGRAYSGSGRHMSPNGSDGYQMMAALSGVAGTGGMTGRSIGLAEAKRKLHKGDLVLFAMSGAAGTTREGRPHSYNGGHFMVLSGHSGSDENSRFSVLDCGANSGGAIVTMSETALAGANCWYITPPAAAPSVPGPAASPSAG